MSITYALLWNPPNSTVYGIPYLNKVRAKAYLECRCSQPQQPAGVLHKIEVFQQPLSKMLLDGCGHSSPNKPPSSGQGSGSSSGIPVSWSLECQTCHPQDQHTHQTLMQTAPLDAQWLVWGLYQGTEIQCHVTLLYSIPENICDIIYPKLLPKYSGTSKLRTPWD